MKYQKKKKKINFFELCKQVGTHKFSGWYYPLSLNATVERRKKIPLCTYVARFIFCSLTQSFSLWCPTSTHVSSGNAAWAGPRCPVLCPTPHAAIKTETLVSPRFRKPRDKSQNWGEFISQSSSFHVVSGP